MRDGTWEDRRCPKCGARLTRYKTRLITDITRRVFVRCRAVGCRYRSHFFESKTVDINP